MFAGFNLHMDEVNSRFEKIGKEIYQNNKRIVEKELDEFIESDGSIDGTELQNHWFPQINADVFISHSHKDLEKAITLAGWLKGVFDLEVFIDSSVWGYADDLLRKIDNRYCVINDGGSYSYEKRNFSTSHIHMMLSTALTSMIDKTECVFFINTQNSLINTKDVILQQTKSPWIYMEIGMTHLIRKQPPNRKVLLEKAHYANKELTIKYRVDTSHLQTIYLEDLTKWEHMYNKSPKVLHALDVFYGQHNLAEDTSVLLG